MSDPGQDAEESYTRLLQKQPTTRVESFLADSTTKHVADLRNLVVLEMRARMAGGDAPEPREYAARFPQFAEQISELLALAGSAEATGWGGDSEQRVPSTHQDNDVTPGNPSVAVASETGELGDYELLEPIGRGGMGVVYRARQKSLNREVAVKTISAVGMQDEQARLRFRLEAEAVARLDHSGIVSVYETGDDDGIAWFSMALIRGEALTQLLSAGPLDCRQAVEIVRQLAEAIHYAHEAGVIHRDLKPGNVLLDLQGRPKLVDFGLARIIDQDGLTATGAAVGTPSYMAPEQITDNEEIGPRTDVYGLGAILYACLTGQPPFRGPSTMATLNLVIHSRPIPIRQISSELPRDVETICLKCLEKNPAERYGSAADLAAELSRFLEGRPILARPLPFWGRFGRWCRRNPAVSSLLVLTFVILLAATAVSARYAVMADSRATAAQQAGQEADEAKKQAEQAAGIAREQSQLALRSLQTIIFTVQDRLRDIAEAREVRRELLTVALQDLKAISATFTDRAAVDMGTAQALTDLAKLYTQLGGEQGDDLINVSMQHYERAAEVCSELLLQDGASTDVFQTATEILMAYGDTAREYRRFADAVAAHRMGRDASVRWFEAYPDDLKAKRAYFRSAEALGEALLRSGDSSGARDYILESVRLADEYCEVVKDIDSLENLNRCYCTLGDFYRITGKPDKSRSAYSTMSDVTRRMMAAVPGDDKWYNDLSADEERFGDLEMGLENYAQARIHFESSLEHIEKYVAGDPSDLFRLQQSTWCYSKLAAVCAKQGDREREKWARARLEEIRSRLRGQ